MNEIVWSSNAAKDKLKERVENNWKMKNYGVFMEEYDINSYGLHPVVAGTTSSTIIIGYQEHQNLVLLDVSKKTLKVIETKFPMVNMRVGANNKILCVCMDTSIRFGYTFPTTLKIYSVEDTNLLFEENFDNFISYGIDVFGTKSIVILLKKIEIELLIFDDENNLKPRLKIPNYIQKLFINNFLFPNMMYCEIQDELEVENHSATVWKYDEEMNTLSILKKIEDFHVFVFRDGEEKREIYNATFVSKFIFAISFVEDNIVKCITRITDIEGIKIRDLNLDIFEISHQETVFYKFRNKFFIERESFVANDNAMFYFDVSEIFNENVKHLFIRELKELQQDENMGYLNYVINNYFIASVKIIRNNPKKYVSVKKLDFFATEE